MGAKTQTDRQTDMSGSESKTSGSFKEEQCKWQELASPDESATPSQSKRHMNFSRSGHCTYPTTSSIRYGLDLQRGSQAGYLC